MGWAEFVVGKEQQDRSMLFRFNLAYMCSKNVAVH